MSQPDEKTSRFNKATVDLVAKRAGYVCSNLDCAAPTSGPSTRVDKSIVVGEAAHIYGAKPGSARFVAEMSFVQRNDITNALWLCRNCHKLIDADELGHPAEVLFEWRRAHERGLASRLGKAASIRNDVSEKKAEAFASISYLAQQIVIDKPSGWEYKLTIEILNRKFYPILRRWNSLNRGLYSRNSETIAIDSVVIWQKARTNEMQRLIRALAGIVENEFAEAWGEPGMTGSEAKILQACDLYCDLASSLLGWEEAVRFVTLPHDFDEYQQAFAGPGGRILESLDVLPCSLIEILESGQKTGRREVTVKLDLPEEWAERCIALFQSAYASARGIDEADFD